MKSVSWWRTTFGEDEIQHIAESIRNECVSQGRVTREFEQKLSEFLGVAHVIAVSSGSTALLLALMAVGVKPGDEVLLPNRTWIATAHAVHILGAKVVLVDVEVNRPIIDVTQIEQKLTPRTRAILPVHMNGRSADMQSIKEIASRHGNIAVIEDAAQAFGSHNEYGFLGTQSDVGCFSLSVAKIISTGQGGFAITNNETLAQRMRSIRTHGVENVKDVEQWMMLGFNFRFTDILASVGIEQLKRLPERIDRLRDLYTTYDQNLRGSPFKLIPVDLEMGEIPIYNEFLVQDRQNWIEQLALHGIETRPFYPDIDRAKYLQQEHNFPNSRPFGSNGIYLPSGPSQPIGNAEKCIQKILEYSR